MLLYVETGFESDSLTFCHKQETEYIVLQSCFQICNINFSFVDLKLFLLYIWSCLCAQSYCSITLFEYFLSLLISVPQNINSKLCYQDPNRELIRINHMLLHLCICIFNHFVLWNSKRIELNYFRLSSIYLNYDGSCSIYNIVLCIMTHVFTLVVSIIKRKCIFLYLVSTFVQFIL